MNKNCIICTRYFKSNSNNQICCSDLCSNINHSKWLEKNKDKLNKYKLDWVKRPENYKRSINTTKAYQKTEKGKEVLLKAHKKYNSSEKGKETFKRNTKTDRFKRNVRDYELRKNYNLTRNEYDFLLKQSIRCAVCEKEWNEKIKPNIDHNHKTGKVRGILCRSCNLLLGLSNDNIDILTKAIKYLKEKDGI